MTMNWKTILLRCLISPNCPQDSTQSPKKPCKYSATSVHLNLVCDSGEDGSGHCLSPDADILLAASVCKPNCLYIYSSQCKNWPREVLQINRTK